MGLISHTISIQSLQESITKILSLERKEGEDRKKKDGARRRAACVLCPGKKERARERGGEGVFNPQQLSTPKD